MSYFSLTATMLLSSRQRLAGDLTIHHFCKCYYSPISVPFPGNARRMTLLAFILLLSFLPAESAKSRYPPKTSKCNLPGAQRFAGSIKPDDALLRERGGFGVPIHAHHYGIFQSTPGHEALCTAVVARHAHPMGFLLAGLNPVFGPQQVYGLIDGSVSIKCFYPPTTVNRHDRKYWCRESSRSCLTVVSTSGYRARGYQGRVTIVDFPEQGIMLVNISQLTLADQGTYQCGIGLNGKGLSNRVSLDISEGNHTAFSFTFSSPF